MGYFTVAGTALVGLLLVVDAYMPKSAHSQFANNFEGLPAAYKGERMHSPAPPIVPAPPVAAAAIVQAPAVETPIVVAEEAAKPAKPAKRKVARKKTRHQDVDELRSGGDDFASIWGEATRERARRDPPSSWREAPSWRDTWASSDSDSRRGRRSASRPNDDFWAFR